MAQALTDNPATFINPWLHRFAGAAPHLPRAPVIDRRHLIVMAVVALHALGLWALQTGLLQRVVEQVVPVQVLADWVEAPQPQIAPPPPQPRPAPARPQAPAPQPKAVAPEPEPLVVPRTEPAPPEPQAPTAVEVAPAPVVSAHAAPTSKTSSDPSPPAPASPSTAPTPSRVELPSSQADYLNNPPPAYPALSKRLGEQGKVLVRVFIEADGRASKAEIRQSSGFDRLDQTALQTVLRWRYVPGKRNGVAEAMWYVVPIQFVLD